MLLKFIKFITFGFPTVSVAVLSSNTQFILFAVCKAPAFLKSIPYFALLPIAEVTATGVAKPNAQGQDITNTLTPKLKDL